MKKQLLVLLVVLVLLTIMVTAFAEDDNRVRLDEYGNPFKYEGAHTHYSVTTEGKVDVYIVVPNYPIDGWISFYYYHENRLDRPVVGYYQPISYETVLVNSITAPNGFTIVSSNLVQKGSQFIREYRTETSIQQPTGRLYLVNSSSLLMMKEALKHYGKDADGYFN